MNLVCRRARTSRHVGRRLFSPRATYSLTHLLIMQDRIQELRRVPASLLKPNPRNWRTHPPAQQAALRGLLSDIGFADAVLARELEDGSLELIDGHLRVETALDETLPVLVLDLSQDEADKLLLALDPLAGMAGVDVANLESLLSEVTTNDPALTKLLDDLAKQTTLPLVDPDYRPEVAIPESYQVVVECEDELAQQDVYERMRGEGYACRVLTL